MAEADPDYSDSDFSDDDQSPLDIAFSEAADHVRKITSKLDNNQLLQLYSFFKQSTEGKCNTARPGWLDGKGRKKWDAWNSLGDLPKLEAKKKYIDLVKQHDFDWSNSAQGSSKKESWVAVSSLRRPSEPELIENDLTLMDAARENCADRVTKLLKSNPDLKFERDSDGLTALHWAADRGATEALTAAVKGGCPLDQADESGQTALHYAASCGHIKATEVLVNAGASLVKDKDGSTPLDIAADDEIRNILKRAASK